MWGQCVNSPKLGGFAQKGACRILEEKNPKFEGKLPQLELFAFQEKSPNINKTSLNFILFHR